MARGRSNNSLNIIDVAQEAGVSIATVSRVLNNTEYPVKAETRQRVLEAVQKLGFRRNDLARGLLLKATHTIGFIIPDISNPYYPALARGVEDTARNHGYAVIFCNTDRNIEKLEQYINVLLQKRVDGVIIAGGGTDYAQASEAISNFDTKVVLIGRHNLPFPSVQVDNIAAAHIATSHLAELGHRRIAFISGPHRLTSIQDRLAGYQRSLAEHNIAYDETLIHEGDFGEESGYFAAQSLLQRSPKPTAIFAANDRMAIGAIAAATDLGLAIPKDLAIAGFDGIAMASCIRPALTTIELPIYEMGVAAMTLMLKLLAGEACEPVVWLPTRLIVRESSSPIVAAAEADQRQSRKEVLRTQ